jgi:hypothetical protein
MCRQGIDEPAHLIEMVFPINTHAQQINLFADEASQPFRLAERIGKPEVQERHFADMRLDRGSHILEPDRRKDR